MAMGILVLSFQALMHAGCSVGEEGLVSVLGEQFAFRIQRPTAHATKFALQVFLPLHPVVPEI